MRKRRERRDPIADYVEWTEHRYDPGYYLGGNFPPDFRESSLSPKGQRYSGIMILVSGAISMALALSWESEMGGADAVFGAFVSALVLVAGIVMFRSGRNPNRASKTRRN